MKIAKLCVANSVEKVINKLNQYNDIFPLNIYPYTKSHFCNKSN